MIKFKNAVTLEMTNREQYLDILSLILDFNIPNYKVSTTFGQDYFEIIIETNSFNFIKHLDKYLNNDS